MLGEGADERFGGDRTVQAGDDVIQRRYQDAEDLGERVFPYRR
jgi:hypothetical protein